MSESGGVFHNRWWSPSDAFFELYLSVVSRNVDGVLSFIEPSEDLGDTIETYGVPVVLVGGARR
ncbi:MAG: hypothetical protein ACLRSW_16915 [Christensenellaceae bacterium]